MSEIDSSINESIPTLKDLDQSDGHGMSVAAVVDTGYSSEIVEGDTIEDLSPEDAYSEETANTSPKKVLEYVAKKIAHKMWEKKEQASLIEEDPTPPEIEEKVIALAGIIEVVADPVGAVVAGLETFLGEEAQETEEVYYVQGPMQEDKDVEEEVKAEKEKPRAVARKSKKEAQKPEAEIAKNEPETPPDEIGVKLFLDVPVKKDAPKEGVVLVVSSPAASEQEEPEVSIVQPKEGAQEETSGGQGEAVAVNHTNYLAIPSNPEPTSEQIRPLLERALIALKIDPNTFDYEGLAARLGDFVGYPAAQRPDLERTAALKAITDEYNGFVDNNSFGIIQWAAVSVSRRGEGGLGIRDSDTGNQVDSTRQPVGTLFDSSIHEVKNGTGRVAFGDVPVEITGVPNTYEGAVFQSSLAAAAYASTQNRFLPGMYGASSDRAGVRDSRFATDSAVESSSGQGDSHSGGQNSHGDDSQDQNYRQENQTQALYA